MTTLDSSKITFRQTLNYVSIIYRIQNIDNDAIRTIVTLSSTSPSYIIHHLQTDISANTYSVSSSNIVIALKKLDKTEWPSLKFEYNGVEEVRYFLEAEEDSTFPQITSIKNREDIGKA
ncbi:3982_t:CDS:2 [Paraglomus occultum]|uniref:3982_t:CDS:1 n=1 Tax=Paraglomus occultum TaxID=144539 RepID=A0A9N9BU47_9GLOM|nr:3982_t:CDS:2 [Paraglomus occultum]